MTAEEKQWIKRQFSKVHEGIAYNSSLLEQFIGYCKGIEERMRAHETQLHENKQEIARQKKQQQSLQTFCKKPAEIIGIAPGEKKENA